jgi:hypothetical protein
MLDNLDSFRSGYSFLGILREINAKQKQTGMATPRNKPNRMPIALSMLEKIDCFTFFDKTPTISIEHASMTRYATSQARLSATILLATYFRTIGAKCGANKLLKNPLPNQAQLLKKSWVKPLRKPIMVDASVSNMYI